MTGRAITPLLARAQSGSARWLRRHAVVLAGLALVAGQLGWTAALLAHSWFRQGDFLLLDRALSQGFGWDYLTRIDGGHLMPAGLAIIWALARISPCGSCRCSSRCSSPSTRTSATCAAGGCGR